MSYSQPTDYFAILARQKDDVHPIGHRTSYGLEEVKSKVQEHWLQVSRISVMWHGLNKPTQLTDRNCQVTLHLLKQRNGIDHLFVEVA